MQFKVFLDFISVISRHFDNLFYVCRLEECDVENDIYLHLNQINDDTL